MWKSHPTFRFDSSLHNEILKQLSYVIYTLNEFKELAQVLRDFMFVENCKVQ